MSAINLECSSSGLLLMLDLYHHVRGEGWVVLSGNLRGAITNTRRQMRQGSAVMRFYRFKLVRATAG